VLEFAAKHNVRPWVQKLPMRDVNEGIKIMLEGKARYRIILEN
jgi:alcohol dehydrogenase (NADP+)